MSETEGRAVEERHASWLELFFDLVAVAGIGALAHLLGADQSSGGLAIYVVAFAAIWMIWACFTVYGNITADRAHVSVILAAMFVLGVMIAAIPAIRGEHAAAFAIAYVVARVLAHQPWQRTTIVIDLPSIQQGAGIVPWVISIWVDGPVRYVLWAIGLALDLLSIVSTSPDRMIADSQARLDRARDRFRRAGRPTTHDGHDIPSTVTAASSDVPHLVERLGLFVLIVIGEGLVQIIDGASEAEWNRPLAVTGVGAFALMAGFWSVAVRFGYAGVPLLPEGSVSPRLSWPAHLVATLALATVAALLGTIVAEPHENVSGHVRWVLVVAYAGYAALGVAVHLLVGSRRRACCLVPMLVASVVVALVPGLRAEAVAWLLAAGVLLAIVALHRTGRHDPETAAG